MLLRTAHDKRQRVCKWTSCSALHATHPPEPCGPEQQHLCLDAHSLHALTAPLTQGHWYCLVGAVPPEVHLLAVLEQALVLLKVHRLHPLTPGGCGTWWDHALYLQVPDLMSLSLMSLRQTEHS
jgi:hypothetical protein